MSNRNWPIALLGIGAPLGVAAWLLLQPYTGPTLSQPVAPVAIAATPDVAAAPVAPAAAVAAPAPVAIQPIAPPPAVVAAPAAPLPPVPDAQRAVIAFTGNVIGETDPCG